MEERLFFVGLAMGAFAWLSKRWGESQSLDTATKTGLWHGFFCGLSAFSAVWVVMMSLDSRARFVGPAAWAISSSELYPSLAAGAIAAAVGFWRGLSRGAAPEGRRYFLSEDLEWAETVFSAVLLASVLMYFVVQAFKIPSGSMRNTLLEGDHLFVNKFIYGLRVPFTGKRVLALRQVQRGDVIVFRFPVDDPRELHCGSIQYGKDFIKRVIGVPGDHIKLVNKDLYLNGKKAAEPYVVHKTSYIDSYRDNFPADPNTRLADAAYRMLAEDVKNGELVVPPDCYFAMGDNRDNSLDSRYWGFVPRDNIIGKPAIIFWSYDTTTERLADPNIISLDHIFDLAVNFFSKTRWKRTLMIPRGYPLS